MSPQQATAMARRMNETPRTPRPNRTPQSLPQWETLQEPPSSASTSSSLKRTIDNVSDQDSPSPAKKKRRSKKKSAPSRAEGTTPDTVTPIINQLSSSHSTLRASSGLHAGNYGQNQIANGSPCEERVDRMNMQGRKTVRFTYATTRTIPSRTDESGGLTPTPSGSGEVTAPVHSTQSSSTEAQLQSSVSPKKTKKRKRSEQVTEPEPESEVAEEAPSPRKRTKSERTAEASDEAPNVEESATANGPRSSLKESGKTKDKGKGKEREMVNPCSSDSSPGAGPSTLRTSAYPESQGEQLELPSSDTLVADDDDEDWIKMLSSELNLDEDHKDILEDMSDEPDDRKLVFLIASQMASNPVPKDARRLFNGLAQEVLLNFSGPCLFKDRMFNNWQLLERIRRKPEKVGLDNSWISNAGKLRLLDEFWQKNFAEARRNIIEKIAESIDGKYSLTGLAHVLDKEVTESDLNILALLRSIYRREGRAGFFNRVDEKLRQLHTRSLESFRRSFERYRRNDAKRFPDTIDAAERAGLRRSRRRRRQRTNQDVLGLGVQYRARPGHA